MANLNIDYLVIAGGGSGGSTGDNIGAGGGGAGGFITSWSGGSGGGQVSQPTLTKSTQVPYTVTVGSGGIAPTAYYDGAGSGGGRGLNGTASIFDSVSATGGGGGGGGGSGNQQIAGGDGGSGGGGASYYTGGKGNNIGSPVQGFDGGTASGVTGGYRIASGGGGAGSAGNNGGTSTSGTIGQGGSGMSYASGSASITNLSATYAGGGGGGTGTGTQSVAGGNDGGGNGGAWQGTSNPPATNGANTGSGGGGGAGYGGLGGNGGSGIVILRYTTADVVGYTTTGSTPTEDTTTIPGQTILSFTIVGTGTITFTALTPTRVSSALADFNSGTEDGLKLPSGNDANQPTGVQGMIRNNTDSGMSFYNGTEWQYFEATSPFIYSSFAAWDVGNAISYGGTGNTLYNIVNNPNGFNFTKYGGVSYDSTNKSFNFNGATGSNGAYMRFSQNAMNIPNGYTVSMWVNFTAFPANTALYAYGYSPSLRQFLTSTQMRYYVSPGPAGSYTPYFNHGITTGNWYNITMVFTTTTVKTYISQEGDSTATLKQTDTTNHGAWQNTNQLYFGCNVQNYNSSFNGQLRIMEIYDSQLSQTDIDSIVNGGSQS